jgi:hypothetical protein
MFYLRYLVKTYYFNFSKLKALCHAGLYSRVLEDEPLGSTHLEELKKLYVHRSMHLNIILIERTNKMQPCNGIY